MKDKDSEGQGKESDKEVSSEAKVDISGDRNDKESEREEHSRGKRDA